MSKRDRHYTEEVMLRARGLLGHLNSTLLPKMLDDIGHPSEWVISKGDGVDDAYLVFSPESNFESLHFESEAKAVGVKWLLTVAWVGLNDDWSDEAREDMN
jgi:hypothetical protein